MFSNFSGLLNCLATLPVIFTDIPWNVYLYCLECLATFTHVMLVTFAGIFREIPRNARVHSPECLATFPGMFGDIPRNVAQNSLKYNIPLISRLPSFPFPFPIFLVLYITINIF